MEKVDILSDLVRFRLQLPTCLLWIVISVLGPFSKSLQCCLDQSHLCPTHGSDWYLGIGLSHNSVSKASSVLFRVRSMQAQPRGEPRRLKATLCCQFPKLHCVHHVLSIFQFLDAL